MLFDIGTGPQHHVEVPIHAGEAVSEVVGGEVDEDVVDRGGVNVDVCYRADGEHCVGGPVG
jgi:hypothetical protein